MLQIDTEFEPCFGPAAHLCRVGEHVLNLHQIEHIHIKNRMISMIGRIGAIQLDTDEQMADLVKHIEVAGIMWVKIDPGIEPK